jgi:chromosome segregation ATPase
LIVVNKGASDQRSKAAQNSATASNTIVSVKKQMDELETFKQNLETNLAATQSDFSNARAVSEANLRTAEANLEKVMAEAKATAKAQADSNTLVLAQRDEKISQLESENQSLDKEAASLRNSITNVQSSIAVTQEKLARSQGDQTFLLKELKGLQQQEKDMDKKLHDVTYVRELLHQLRSENAIARRLDWMRRGIYATFNEKGGERLMDHSPSVPPPGNSGATVELKEHGGVKIQAPTPTNAPPK